MATIDAADGAGLEVFLLDMGREKYGDAILCRLGERSILIDGGHPGDLEDHGEYLSIPNQLAEIFGHDPPFDISLLVVTHCHNDHIGCLPEMVAEEIIRPEWALVADLNLGFGIPVDGDDVLDAPDVTPAMQRVIAALREENQSDLSDAQLERFIDAVAKLVDRYEGMCSSLKTELDDQFVRYGIDESDALVAEFADFGLKILGPTQDHLLICAESIRQAVDSLVEDLREVVADGEFGDAADLDDVAVYRALASEVDPDTTDAGRPGFALNDQSIVLQIQQGTAKVLLTGDMQFAEPGIDDLEPFMEDLRAVVAAEAPFDLVKIAHHASHNAFDKDVLTEMGSTRRYVISGGIEDHGHPHKDVLKLLKKARADDGIEWARTDKNGMITATIGDGGDLKISRGRKNSSRPNVFDVAAEVPPVVSLPLPVVGGGAVVQTPTAAPPEQAAMRVPDVVRVTTEVPHTSTQVTITINVQPGGGGGSDGSKKNGGVDVFPPPHPWRLGGGRRLPKLLFVTCRSQLEKNIGPDATKRAIQAIRDAEQPLVEDLPAGATEPQQVLDAVRSGLQANLDVRGVVILGGYDVVPASRLDAIDPALRTAIENADSADGQVRDIDQFVVWSDAIFGDRDGDGMSELPVSRIPDGHSAELVERALHAEGGAPLRRAGVRNLARPFADKVFDQIHFPLHKKLLVSQPTHPQSADWSTCPLQDAAIYIMLHGNYLNPTSFAGEDPRRNSFTAIRVDNVKQHRLQNAVVFAGCCWGALTVRERAIDVGAGGAVAALRPDDSMALSFLKAGALAFVGCTGVHYSPPGSAPTHNGGPMHVAFWKHYASGLPPAEALYSAKKDYLAGIPHDRSGDAFDRAIELKILRQFTCLGLGW